MCEHRSIDVAIIGGGPAGLMVASVIAGAGYSVRLFEAKPSLGRKFLMAGKSGLNITKSESTENFLNQYSALSQPIEKALSAFWPTDVIAWCEGLGVETFIGSSGRVFPKAMKASQLLRGWLNDLAKKGVSFATRHRWSGFDEKYLCFETPDGPLRVEAKASIFALGGKSWARLGADGAWQKAFEAIGVEIAPFQPSNCGFTCAWDAHFITKYAGEPVKSVIARHNDMALRGDFVITRDGVEGGIIYPFAASLRADLACGKAVLTLDLKPDVALEKLERQLLRPRGKNSLSNHLRKSIQLSGVKAGFLRMVARGCDWQDMTAVARFIKALPLEVLSPSPIDEAISTAGGVCAHGYNENFMLNARAGTFVAGEMLDWDAPTGGYLITACLATGKAAGEGALSWLSKTG